MHVSFRNAATKTVVAVLPFDCDDVLPIVGSFVSISVGPRGSEGEHTNAYQVIRVTHTYHCPQFDQLECVAGPVIVDMMPT